MKAIIVEDNIEIRREIESLVEVYCGQEVVVSGSAATVVEAIKLISRVRPELLLLDIDLPDGTAFDILEIIDFEPKVIFITGSEEYAVRAFKVAAVDYLVKPVDPLELQNAVKRAVLGNATQRKQIGIARESYTKTGWVSDVIALHTAEKIRYTPLDEILRCEADGNYTRFLFRDGSGLLVAKTLKEYDQVLTRAGFIRVHQSHLVNPKFISEFVKGDGGYIVMSDGIKVPVSTRKRTEVLQRLESRGL